MKKLNLLIIQPLFEIKIIWPATTYFLLKFSSPILKDRVHHMA